MSPSRPTSPAVPPRGSSGGGESPALRPAKSRHVPVPFPSPRSCPLGAVAARLAFESHEPFLARSLSNATPFPPHALGRPASRPSPLAAIALLNYSSHLSFSAARAARRPRPSSSDRSDKGRTERKRARQGALPSPKRARREEAAALGNTLAFALTCKDREKRVNGQSQRRALHAPA